MVRIPGFHPGGPGSIPGMGTFSLFFYTYLCSKHSFSLSLSFFVEVRGKGNIIFSVYTILCMVTRASKLLCLQICGALTTPDGYQVRQDILKCVHWPQAIAVMCGIMFWTLS